ncbi:MAG TPA: type II toxin-antitoxin system ParD family antitoxin [Methylococcaceae bacterium]|jgi:antitoxin ParD1/3/4|nr:type II toxin-antitoxin system ParD family antitoxin [Methylococcaceae bacterium]
MPTSYALGSHFEDFVKQQVTSGRYNNASEVIRTALRLLEDQEKLREARLTELKNAIREGMESGPAVPADDVFDRLERKYVEAAQNSGS